MFSLCLLLANSKISSSSLQFPFLTPWLAISLPLSSYLHCEWATISQLEKDKRIHQKLKRFKTKMAQMRHFFHEVIKNRYCLSFISWKHKLLDLSALIDSSEDLWWLCIYRCRVVILIIGVPLLNCSMLCFIRSKYGLFTNYKVFWNSLAQYSWNIFKILLNWPLIHLGILLLCH